MFEASEIGFVILEAMHIPLRPLSTLALLLSITAGCDSAPPPNGIATLGDPATLRGVVRDEAGAPVAGVMVVAQGRLNDNRATATALTAADGSFEITAPASSYDVGFDLEGSALYATNFYGPVMIGEGATRDFVLHGAEGLDDETVYGRVFLRTGEPASGRMLRLHAATAAQHDETLEAAIPADVQATTDASGSFMLQLGASAQEVELDIEMFEADGTMDEFVSIATRGKPTYVEFVTEEFTVEDTTRAGEASAADIAGLANTDEPLEGDYTITQMRLTSSNPRGGLNRRFECSGSVIRERTLSRWDLWSVYEATDLNLSAENNSEWRAFTEIFNGYGQTGGLGLKRSGKWWYTWRFMFEQKGPSRGNVRFTDETNDTYSVRLGGDYGVYAVNYNSDRPGVVRLVFEVD